MLNEAGFLLLPDAIRNMNMKSLIGTVLLLSVISFAQSQVQPVEGSSLNYRIIGFSFPSRQGSDSYMVEIAAGRYSSTMEDSFKRNIVATYHSNTPRLVGEVPYWNCDYTWRVVCLGKDKKKVDESWQHFSTGYSKAVDTSKWRFSIDIPSRRFHDYYFFADATKTMYDMDGNAVWYLPPCDINNDRTGVRDLKPTKDGNITFLAGSKDDVVAGEVDYNGNLLWKSPNDGAVSGGSEHYNHEVTKLSNGHFMVLGNENFPLYWYYFPTGDSGLYIQGSANLQTIGEPRKYKNAPFGNVIEYDSSGKVVWSWRSCDYYRGKNLKDHIVMESERPPVQDLDEQEKVVDSALIAWRQQQQRSDSGAHSAPDTALLRKIRAHRELAREHNDAIARHQTQNAAGNPSRTRREVEVDTVDDHVNSFFFDEPNKMIYVSFKNVNLVMKITYPEGRVVDVYTGNDSLPGSLFCGQHAVNLTSDGRLLLYNNNDCHLSEAATVAVLALPATPGGQLKSVWNFTCPIDEMPANAHKPPHTSGGNVTEMPGGALFVSMAVPAGIFIVDKKRQIIWSGIIERCLPRQNIWHKTATYRASIVSRQELEQLIWRQQMP
jgi:Arylsulfotransferase (ASST)